MGWRHEFDLLPLVVCRFWGRLEPSEYHTRSRSCSSGGRKIYSALPAGSDLSESSPRALRLWRGGGLFVHTSGSNHHSSVLGSVGGGLEYRFTPHIGIFSDAGYEIVDGPKNNFMQVNFGLKYAF